MNPLQKAMMKFKGNHNQQISNDFGQGYHNTVVARPPIGDEQGARYYSGQSRFDDDDWNGLPNPDADIEAFKIAMYKMQNTPQDSIPRHQVWSRRRDDQ